MKKIIAAALLLTTLTSLHTMAQPDAKPTLNHIALYVNDLKTSTHFYHNIMGLDTIPEPFKDGRHTWLSIGHGLHLHLVQPATPATPGPRTYLKSDHICFSVPSVNDFIAILQKHKVDFENLAGEINAVTNRVDGVKQIYFKDPDGHWIEVNDARE